jgi:hypothetical protein
MTLTAHNFCIITPFSSLNLNRICRVPRLEITYFPEAGTPRPGKQNGISADVRAARHGARTPLSSSNTNLNSLDWRTRIALFTFCRPVLRTSPELPPIFERGLLPKRDVSEQPSADPFSLPIALSVQARYNLVFANRIEPD